MGGEMDYLPLRDLREVVPAVLTLVSKQPLVYNLDHNCYSVHRWPLSDLGAQFSDLDGIVISAQDADCVYTKFREHRRIFIIKTVPGNVLICNGSRLFSLLKSKLDIVIRKGICLAADEDVKIDAKLLKANVNEQGGCSADRRHKRVLVPNPEQSEADIEDDVTLAYLVDQSFNTNPTGSSDGRSTVRESQSVQASDHETDTIDMSSCLATNASNYSQHRSIVGVDQISRTRNTLTNSLNRYSSSLFQPERRQNSQYTSYTADATSYNSKPQIPKHPDYLLLSQRHSSFQTSIWGPLHAKPQIDTLTECGFFFTGYSDLVRCYQCGIGLKDWDKDDDVLAEHVQYSSNCLHLRKMNDRREPDHDKNALTGQADTNNKSNILVGAQYQTMEARIASYTTFPSRTRIQHRTHAVAGLYYTGNGDLCRCFTCDGGLKDWSNGDDPIKEHATHFPTCSYINQIKGQEYVRSLQQTNTNNSFTASATAGNSAIAQASAASSMDTLSIDTTKSSLMTTQVVQSLGYSELDVVAARVELETKGNDEPTSDELINTILDMQERTNIIGLTAMAEENKRLSQFVKCMLCVTGEPDILFLPCAHRRVCHDCAHGRMHCPSCGSVIREKVKTYRA